MNYTQEAVCTDGVIDAVNELHCQICSVLKLDDCYITPISCKALIVDSKPVVYLVKVVITQPGCPSKNSVCLLRIAVNLDDAMNTYTLVSIKCSVSLDDGIVPF
ncbi:hypothetical protein ACOME3_004829 [Neoechinorhynchus agilis]